MESPIISVKNLKKTFRSGEVEVNALRGVSIDIFKGEFLAIMGASGSGKSTFMNIVGCLDTATEGDYFLEGRNVRGLTKNELADIRNKKLGFVFQSYNLLPRTSAFQNVELPLLYNKDISNKERKDRAMTALNSVGLLDRMNNFPNQLSGGQQQRVAIARALINDPLLILADEPTGNLDSKTSYEIMEIFQNLHAKGRTIIFVTHEPDIAQFADTNIIFKDGKINKNIKVEIKKDAKAELQKMLLLAEKETE